jgi:hypothetical protein
MRISLAIILLLCLLAAAASAQPPKGYLCYRAAGPIEMDGSLDDPAWQLAHWTDDFVDIEGSIKPKPRFKTRAKMIWDDSCFYIGAELQEPQVWGTITQRDAVIFHDNDFEIFMDPNGDNFEYGEFEINGLNTGWDLFLPKPYKDGGTADNTWDISNLRTAVQINGTLNDPSDTDAGWTVEIAMPWRDLERCSHSQKAPKDGQQWRLNFSRVEWPVDTVGGHYVKVSDAREDNWVWTPQGVIDMHRPEQWGFVQFSKLNEGAVPWKADSLFVPRSVLHRVYYAEQDYYKAHKKWTAKWNDLSLVELSTIPRIERTTGGFTASLDWKNIAVHIRQDSYFWIDSLRTR